MSLGVRLLKQFLMQLLNIVMKAWAQLEIQQENYRAARQLFEVNSCYYHEMYLPSLSFPSSKMASQKTMYDLVASSKFRT